MSLGHGTPEGHLQANVGLVTNRNGALLLLGTVAEVDGAGGADIEDDSDDIDCARLRELLNFLETGKGKADTLDLVVLSHTLNRRLSAESEAVVVGDRCEALVGNLDHTVGEGEHGVYFKDLIKLRGLFVECGSLNHCSLFVHEIEIEKLARLSGIFPAPHGGLLDDTSFDSPVGRKLVQGFDGHVVGCRLSCCWGR